MEFSGLTGLKGWKLIKLGMEERFNIVFSAIEILCPKTEEVLYGISD